MLRLELEATLSNDIGLIVRIYQGSRLGILLEIILRVVLG